ncbi:hypothetical protein DFP72DRAFT_1138508 [Ephemerocybe angulata]|uniref:Uncharacterized protein n=1 Tax=Ephemerocybe angulata TaxID=980116 RepID=A0A8H6HRB7_9AGAR|nr:hypothetical protein DFP72DRAFT_1138508 [Tulosesus angulatus]
MRVPAFIFISIAASLATYVAAYTPESSYDARELVDEFVTRDLDAYALERRELLADLSTRALISELQERLERRGDEKERKKLQKGFTCPYCTRRHQTFDQSPPKWAPVHPSVPTPPAI